MSAKGFLFRPLWNLYQPKTSITSDPGKPKKIRGNKRTTARMVPSPGPRGEELDEVVGGHVEQRVEVDAAVAVLAERPLLGRAGGDLGLNIDIRLRDTN
jgi:hypothetical protein